MATNPSAAQSNQGSLAASTPAVPPGWSMARTVIGYPRLGTYMGLIPEVAILRRFGDLNAQNLLYLQAEIVHLERELRELELADSLSTIGRKPQYAVDWFWLSRSELDGDQKQWNKFCNIREKLREYNEAIIQQATIAALPEPSAYDLNDIQRYLAAPEMGRQAFRGADQYIWGSTVDSTGHAPDLISLRGRHSEDPFSKWVTEKFTLRVFQCFGYKFKKIHPRYGVVVCEDSKILAWTRLISSVVASLLPVASIILLHTMQSMAARLAIIATFNVVFSVLLCQITTAKGGEIFAATAA
ncbi:hypothetical protein W97_03569 [Coniosporium apollinis CBS 100218]|uniref:DUF6594 domain-containing protein n=1 Tax=Coniosporium apollinis (strain CBS 100218) TaxID=1168221 RepID=R7YR45_CONA1|nr:uncharacterized protein W97_03569 [Coniosporium apollinis CBS 100218]EON64338.1 hypothetical protein W97_03569 [Coniosporium apollinis CBS 100218]